MLHRKRENATLTQQREADKEPRLTWERPQLSRLSAGSAENDIGQRNDSFADFS
jgi:hypothetical protein